MTSGVRLESRRIWPTDFEMVDLRDTWPHEIVTKQEDLRLPKSQESPFMQHFGPSQVSSSKQP